MSIEKQIKDTFYKVFSDNINNTINSESPDYDWIITLYKEIKQRLLKLIKKDSPTYKHIHESFDVN